MSRVADAVLLLVTYQTWIYSAFGLLGILLFFSWAWAQRKFRFTTFGLERENLYKQQNNALTSLVMIVCISLSVWLSNAFISPNLTEIMGVPPTATSLRATLIPTFTVTPPVLLPGAVTATVQATVGPTATRTRVPVAGANCLNPRAGITSPIPGSILSGTVEVRGNANIDNFAFYEVQVSSLGSNWLTILTDNKPIANGLLGKWNTGTQAPGEYGLRLVVYNSTGKAPDPCTIPITIVPLPTKTPAP